MKLIAAAKLFRTFNDAVRISNEHPFVNLFLKILDGGLQFYNFIVHQNYN